MSEQSARDTSERSLSPTTLRWMWFLVLWYLDFQTMLAQPSRQLVILKSAIIVGAALIVSAYSG